MFINKENQMGFQDAELPGLAVLAIATLVSCSASQLCFADAPGVNDPLRSGSCWSGYVEQDGRRFQLSVTIEQRKGEDILGDIRLEFEDGSVGRLAIEGMVVEGRYVSWITDGLSGNVTFPGLYAGTIADNRIEGTWRVPGYGQRGAFVLELDR